MAICGLQTKKASATIRMGQIKVSTPEVISINVSKTRGQMVGTASVSFRYKGDFAVDTGSDMFIWFNNSIVFTGIIKRFNISPAITCSGDLIVRASAEDVMSRLVNQQITRRQKLAGLGPFAQIVGLHKRIDLGYNDPPSRHDVTRGASRVEALVVGTNFVSHPMWLGGQDVTTGSLNPMCKISDQMITYGGPSTGGGSFILHDHTTLDLQGDHAGGPSKAVFGIK